METRQDVIKGSTIQWFPGDPYRTAPLPTGAKPKTKETSGDPELDHVPHEAIKLFWVPRDSMWTARVAIERSMSEGWSSWGACVPGRKDGPGPIRTRKFPRLLKAKCLERQSYQERRVLS